MNTDEILRQMQQDGFNPPPPLMPDERIHRFGDDSKKSCWYRGFRNTTRFGEEFYVFLYGDWRDGETRKAMSGAKLDKQDRARIEDQIRKAKRDAEKEKKQLNDKTAEEAKKRWETYSSVFGKNEYLERKGLKELYGARINGFNLAIAMRNVNGEIRNIETVTATDKKGMYGGERTGLFHQIGEPNEVIYLCEGFASAASVYSVMGDCAVAAFNASNLVPVAEALAKKYPEKRIVVCADNDHANEVNTGVLKGEEAAKISGGKIAIPKFEKVDPGATDFNDLLLIEGAESVFEQISSVNPLVQVESFDREYIVNHPFPDENPKTFARKGTLSNIVELLRRLRVTVRYNVITKEEEILIPGHSCISDNMATATRSYVIDWCERASIPYANLDSYITTLANANPYNPVAAWIDSKPWDGTRRLQSLYDTIVAQDESVDVNILAMKEKLIRTWMISAVRAAYEPDGLSCHGVLVFQGAQYLGKTAWFKHLVPQELDLIADGMFLKPDDRDSVFQSVRRWIVELGELDATFRKADIAQLKSFITRSRDVIRRPFARKESSYPRRTVFFGSVNEVDFLKDPTGNRRFWTIECESINYSHGLDMQQIWAEIKVLVDKGEPHILRSEEVDSLNSHNEKFQESDPIFERIASYFPWQDTMALKLSKTATDVCIEIGVHNPTKAEVSAAGRALRRLAGTQKKSNGRKVWAVPIRVST